MKEIVKFLVLCILALGGIFLYLDYTNKVDIGLQIAQEDKSALKEQTRTVEMYSLTTCGYCTKRREEFDRVGVDYVEFFIDKDASARERLNQKLAANGVPSGSIGTPLFIVNGKILRNNPPLRVLAKYW